MGLYPLNSKICFSKENYVIMNSKVSLLSRVQKKFKEKRQEIKGKKKLENLDLKNSNRYKNLTKLYN